MTGVQTCALPISADHTVCIWNVSTGMRLAELKRHLGSVNSVAFSPDGRHIVSGSNDNTVCIWNVTMVESASEVPHGELSASSMTFI